MANSCTTLDDPKPCFRQRRTFKKQHFFYEFFDGDTGKGSMLQSNRWTALIANLIMEMETINKFRR
jgi:hypothetical protein